MPNITTLVGDFPQVWIGIAIGLLIACAIHLIRKV